MVSFKTKEGGILVNKKTVTVSEMMQILNIGRNTAYQLVNDRGFYPAFHIGRKILINLELLDKWLEEQGKAAVCKAGEGG